MGCDQDIDESFDAYADGELTAEQAETLQQALRSSDDCVDRFVRSSLFHAALYDFARQALLQTNAKAEQDDAPDRDLEGALAYRHASFDGFSRRRRMKVWAAAAAVILIGALFAAGWKLGSRPVVAQLNKASATVAWNGSATAAPSAGQFLRQGSRLNLSAGRVVVTFSSGAQVCIQGPAQFVVAGENAMRLDAGRISAYVPGQAVGFEVVTPIATVRDLGTEFTLHVDKPEVLELFVFTGLVDLVPAASVGGQHMRVSENRSIEFDGATGEVRRISFDDVEFFSL